MGIFDFFKKKTGEAQIPAESENMAEEKRDAVEAEMTVGEVVVTDQAPAEPSQTQAAATAGEETADRSGAQAGDQANWVEAEAGERLVNSADRQSAEMDAAAGSGEAAAKREAEECFAVAENEEAAKLLGEMATAEDVAAESKEADKSWIEPAAEAAQEEAVSELEPVEEAPQKKGFFRKLVEGLSKTRQHVMQGVNDVLSSFTSIDEEFYEELEEALIMGDLGVNTAIKIVAGLKTKVKERKIKDPQQVKSLLKEELKEQMRTAESAYDFINQKSVILVIGVNGVGKTTTIGKLAAQYKKDGKQVMLAAADTFRAAAIDQLKEWANRSAVPIVAQAENSDPGAVIFDAIASAKSKGVDILICDTAGRLHNKKNLMAELGKIYRIIGREYPEAHLEVFLVLDSTTGQNALAQAKEFKEMADITGIVLTKLDGTSKGGIAVAIAADLALPVKYIGVGEGIEDLRPFDADSFIEALFEE